MESNEKKLMKVKARDSNVTRKYRVIKILFMKTTEDSCEGRTTFLQQADPKLAGARYQGKEEDPKKILNFSPNNKTNNIKEAVYRSGALVAFACRHLTSVESESSPNGFRCSPSPFLPDLLSFGSPLLSLIPPFASSYSAPSPSTASSRIYSPESHTLGEQIDRESKRIFHFCVTHHLLVCESFNRFFILMFLILYIPTSSVMTPSVAFPFFSCKEVRKRTGEKQDALRSSRSFHRGIEARSTMASFHFALRCAKLRLCSFLLPDAIVKEERQLG